MNRLVRNGLLAITVLAVVAFGSPAHAVLIDFSEFPIGTVITNQYAPLGVVFAALTGNAPIIASDSAMPTSPVLSPNPPFSGDFQWNFFGVGGATGVQFLSGFWDVVGTAIVNVFDINNMLVATRTNTATGVFLFDLTALGVIGRVTFNSFNDPAGADIDNLQFTPVPEPSSLLLVGTGLVGFVLFARRRRSR